VVWLVDVFGGFTMNSWLSFLSLAVLLFVTPVIILRRISTHRRVTVRTIAGAMCVYLQIGIAFALLYRVLMIINPAAITSARPIDGLSYLYMSFITLTTVGYGDVTPVANPARVAAMFEALLGQVFLVVIVARLVSVYGQDRPATAEELAKLAAEGGRHFLDDEALPPPAPDRSQTVG
jgi:hypothetical protein